MEILNNLWMAISTPNEGLVNVFILLLSPFENIVTMIFFISIFDIKSTWKQKILYVLSVTILGLILINIIPQPYSIFLNYLMMSITLHYIFKLSFLKSILAIILSAITFALTGTLISNPYVQLLNINTELLLKVPLYRFLYWITTYAIILIISMAIRYTHFKINFLDDIDKTNKIIIFANLILGLITLIIQSIITFYYLDILPMIITFLSFISLLAYFSISLFSLTRVMKLTLTTRKLESVEEYNNILRILHDNVRGFKHDFDNIITTIGGYIQTNDIEGLKKYYLQLEEDCQHVNNLYILNPDLVNNDGIYNLLTKKYYEAESKNIKINISFLLDLNTLNMKIYEFARILGILLDNAIEAAAESEEKEIFIEFRDDIKNSRQIFLIKNTYKDKNIDTNKIFELNISSKENHNGIGLWEVSKILKKYNNVHLNTSATEKYFSQQLEIFYQTKK